MKIAQVAPLFERVPPKAYGGTERVISYLTEELIRQGHEVTLFATGDSITGAQLIAPSPEAMRPEQNHYQHAWLAKSVVQMEMLRQRAEQFDIVHFHTDYLHFPITGQLGTAHVTTLHGRLDLPELAPLYHYFHRMPLVSISNNQRSPLPDANWQATVYHGLPVQPATMLQQGGDYFAFVGRISPEKRLDRAVDIALQCGVPLVIGAKVDEADQPYFEREIRPLFENPLISFLGEINDHEKRELLQQARALLFPIDWPEPFGLVMIEAFSYGTPVIAYRHGSVPEIMEHGVTGFVVDNQQEAIRAAREIGVIDRHACRQAFERRFTAERMVCDYLEVYRALIEARQMPAMARTTRPNGSAGRPTDDRPADGRPARSQHGR